MTETKEINSEKTQSYPSNSQNDINVSLKLDQNGMNGHSTSNGDSNGSIGYRLDEQPLSPTQALCLMTTVPQNIVSRSLGDKHTPTRNSLRHSRMIVMNRHGKVPKKYLPYIIRNYKLVKAAKVITIVLGIFLCVLSAWMVLWSPTLTAIDFPYWSAVPVLFSGTVGCFFLGFCPRPYPGRRMGWYYHLTKFISILTTAVSVMATSVVSAINITHLVYLCTAMCVPHDTLNTTCVCTTNSTTLFNTSYHYEDLTCDEINYFLKAMVVIVALLNLTALVLDTYYLCAHWTSRTKYVYAKVPLTETIRTIDS